MKRRIGCGKPIIMKITKIETPTSGSGRSSGWCLAEAIPALPASPPGNTLGCRIYTSDGLVGLGETYYLPRAVSAVIHDLPLPRC